MRKGFVISALIAITIVALMVYMVSVWWLIVLGLVLLLTVMGVYDMIQTKHSIMRTYPVFGRMRFWMEDLRPKMYQYFVEAGY